MEHDLLYYIAQIINWILAFGFAYWLYNHITKQYKELERLKKRVKILNDYIRYYEGCFENDKCPFYLTDGCDRSQRSFEENTRQSP